MRIWLVLMLACAGCGQEACNSFDLDCFLKNLTLRDDDGSEVPITIVKRESAEAVLGGWGDPGSSPRADLGSKEEFPDFSVPIDLRMVDLAIAPSLSLGCFVDRFDVRDLSGIATQSVLMTRDMCAKTCVDHPFFALQDGNWCYCGNSYGKYGPAPASDCYMTCSGDGAQTCGGYLRNTVYGKASALVDMAVAADMAEATTGATSGGTTGGTTGGSGGTTGGGGTAPVAETPTLDLETPSLTIAPDMPAPIEVRYHDGNKCTPAICMSMCSRGGRCASVVACIPPRRDGIIDGVWRSNLGTRYEPADMPSIEAALPMIGVGSVDCKDPIEDMKAVERGETNPRNSGAVAAALVTMELTIQKRKRESGSSGGSSGGTSGGSSGGTTGGASQCSAYQSPGCSGARCSYRACASAGVGSCSAWYDTSTGQRFACAACQSCTAAASSVINYCCPRQP